ncbi:MAG: hypothetical protein QHH02_06665 [Syntrophomonadaceae bacterium]|nr:hypothetical protein [Syntrophomonadaceae bacterium]
MFSPDQFNAFFEEMISQLGGSEQLNPGRSSCHKDESKKDQPLPPSSVLAIAGLLAGVLRVGSILIASDQTIQIRLDGSVKKKSDLAKMMDKIGAMPFDAVARAMLERLK